MIGTLTLNDIHFLYVAFEHIHYPHIKTAGTGIITSTPPPKLTAKASDT